MAGPWRRSDSPRPTGELPGLLSGRSLALLAATRLEADPLLNAMEQVRPLVVAGKEWFLGSLPTLDKTLRDDQGGSLGQTGARGEVPCILQVTGYDKANAAHSLTCLLQAHSPRLVIQFGVAGAFPGQGLDLRDLVLPVVENYADTGSSSPEGWLSTQAFAIPLVEIDGAPYWNSFPLDMALVAAASRLLVQAHWDGGHPVVAEGPAITLSEVTGLSEEADTLRLRWQALIETMEGAAAAQVCALYHQPFLELRAISNLVADRDRSAWDLPGAAARAAEAVRLLAGRLEELLEPAAGKALNGQSQAAREGED